MFLSQYIYFYLLLCLSVYLLYLLYIARLGITIVGTTNLKIGNNTQVSNSFVVDSVGSGISIINTQRAIVYKTTITGSFGSGIWSSYGSQETTIAGCIIQRNSISGINN